MRKKILGVLFLSVAAFASINMNACKSCHGAAFEKSALGKSKIVSTLSKEEIKLALEGYQNGTYGGPMKGLMKAQLSGLTDPESLAHEIFIINNPEVMAEPVAEPAKKDLGDTLNTDTVVGIVEVIETPFAIQVTNKEEFHK